MEAAREAEMDCWDCYKRENLRTRVMCKRIQHRSSLDWCIGWCGTIFKKALVEPKAHIYNDKVILSLSPLYKSPSTLVFFVLKHVNTGDTDFSPFRLNSRFWTTAICFLVFCIKYCSRSLQKTNHTLHDRLPHRKQLMESLRFDWTRE